MKAFLYAIVEIIARLHSHLLKMNDAYEYNFSDKELHFLIIGALGMAMIFVVHPLFKWLVKNNHIMVVSWIYVFTLIIVITFAIEIGQRVTHTGQMEFADIMFGVLGFISMFLVFSVFRGIYHLILRFIKDRDEDDQDEEEEETDDVKMYRNSRQDKERQGKRAQGGSGYVEEPYKGSQQGRRTQSRSGYEEKTYRDSRQGSGRQSGSGYGEEPYKKSQQGRRVQGGNAYGEETYEMNQQVRNRQGRNEYAEITTKR